MNKGYNMNTIADEDIYNKIKNYIGLSTEIHNDNIVDRIKEICVKKLCEVVGIKCGCNYNGCQ